MSYIFKFRGDDDSSSSGSSKSPQLKVPASNSDESRIVGTSSVPGKGQNPANMLQQTCVRSTQIQSQENPTVQKEKARKTIQNSKNNLPITHFVDKDRKNLEITAPLLTKSMIQPVANADSTSSSPITSKGAICQKSPSIKTPHQLEQPHKASESYTKRKVLSSVETKTSVSEERKQTSSVPSTQRKATLAPQIHTVDKTSSEKDKGPLADLNENVLPSLTPALTTQMMKDSSVEARMAALHGEPLEIAQEVINEVSVNSSDATLKLSDFELTPQKAREPNSPINKKSSKAVSHGEQFEMAEEVKVSNVVHEVGANGSDVTMKLPDPELTPSKETREPNRPIVKNSSKAAKALVEKKAGKAKPRVSREVAKLLQDEGAERIMQEMEGKGTNRKRTATNDRFYGERRSHFHRERLISDEDENAKKKKKNDSVNIVFSI